MKVKIDKINKEIIVYDSIDFSELSELIKQVFGNETEKVKVKSEIVYHQLNPITYPVFPTYPYHFDTENPYIITSTGTMSLRSNQPDLITSEKES